MSRGADPSAPGFIYLITHDSFNAHKIGIRNVGTKRIDNHRRSGWALWRERYFDTTFDAYRVERSIVEWWRVGLGLPPHVARELMPQAGWTETVSADALSLPDVWAKVLELAAAQVATPAGEVPEFVAPEQLVLWAA